MSAYPSLRPLYLFPGWVIEDIKISSDIGLVKLRIDKRCKHKCPECGKQMAKNRITIQSAWDLPLGQANLVRITYEALQCKCSSCKISHTFLPPGIDKRSRSTVRLMHYVCRLCRFMPAYKVPNFISISESTASRWDKKVLSQSLPEPNLDNLNVILVDEKSIGRHHNYLTVVINGETGEVLHLAEGKKKKSLESFFDKLTDNQKSNIKAVGIDRAGAYKSVIKDRIPKAAIVYDKFHIVANYNKAIDEVRRSEWRKAEQEKKGL